MAAVRAVGNYALADVARWEETTSAKAMKAALDRKLRQDTAEGGRYKDLRRQEPRDRPRPCNEVMIMARRLQRELGGRDQVVCYKRLENANVQI